MMLYLGLIIVLCLSILFFFRNNLLVFQKQAQYGFSKKKLYHLQHSKEGERIKKSGKQYYYILTSALLLYTVIILAIFWFVPEITFSIVNYDFYRLNETALGGIGLVFFFIFSYYFLFRYIHMKLPSKYRDYYIYNLFRNKYVYGYDNKTGTIFYLLILISIIFITLGMNTYILIDDDSAKINRYFTLTEEEYLIEEADELQITYSFYRRGALVSFEWKATFLYDDGRELVIDSNDLIDIDVAIKFKEIIENNNVPIEIEQFTDRARDEIKDKTNSMQEKIYDLFDQR